MTISRIRHPRSFDIETLKEELIDMYVVKKLSMNMICKRFNFGSPRVLEAFERWGVQKREKSEILRSTFELRKQKRVCVSCQQSFMGTYNNKFCKNCVPTPTARIRISNHGLSDPQFQMMLEAQNCACAICKKRFESMTIHKRKSSAVVVDHDHKTGMIRGLLCSPCNISLGHIETKSSEWMKTALLYSKGVI